MKQGLVGDGGGDGEYIGQCWFEPCIWVTMTWMVNMKKSKTNMLKMLKIIWGALLGKPAITVGILVSFLGF